MVQVKILKHFEDKYTGLDYRVGDVVDFSEERLEEINLALIDREEKFIEILEDVTDEIEEEKEAEEKPITKRGRSKKEENKE